MKQGWEQVFLDWAQHLRIDSKELGVVPLTHNLYNAQIQFIREICEGLDRGVHDFKNLKARQLGISTVSLAFDLFWASMFDGLQGAIVTDTEANKEKFRILIERYTASLPKGLRVGIKSHNRNNLVLNNGSNIDYLVAGVRQKTRAGLGRSRALNFIHATEVSSWGSYDDYASLQSALAEHHPNRLFIWESTARGYNLWNKIWNEAKADQFSQKAFFLGWWSKESYSIQKDSPEFEHYWNGKLDDGEQELCDQVWEQYQHRITPEQIAWHRKQRTVKITDEDVLNAEFPWTEQQAFVLTGKSFFPLRRISQNLQSIEDENVQFKAYRYHLGENFLATQIEPVFRTVEADLRIWEEPQPNGVYAIGVDPAYGRSDNKDGHCIEVYRCYADKLVQVAEYDTTDPETFQVAWVMAHLAGSYRNVWINLEVNGPGAAIMDELRHLKQLVYSGYLNAAAQQAGMVNVFGAVKWYLYHKPDSMGPGYVYNWKTNADNKLLILNQLRDGYHLGQIIVRSIPMLEEMKVVVQDGGEIGADFPNHDDRVFASALATKSWIDWIRPGMIGNGHTYEAVVAREVAEVNSPRTTMVNGIVDQFFVAKAQERVQREVEASWGDDV